MRDATCGWREKSKCYRMMPCSLFEIVGVELVGLFDRSPQCNRTFALRAAFFMDNKTINCRHCRRQHQRDASLNNIVRMDVAPRTHVSTAVWTSGSRERRDTAVPGCSWTHAKKETDWTTTQLIHRGHLTHETSDPRAAARTQTLHPENPSWTSL